MSARVLFAAGGTGGHIFPALAVADAMRRARPDVEIAFVGTEHGMEGRLVPRHGYPLELIDVRYLKGTRPLEFVKRVALLPRSGWQALRVIRRFKPGLVVGSGGYASGPVVGLASLMQIPTAIMEQNAIAGLTNRILSRFVRRIFVSFDGDHYGFPASKQRSLGNPVRQMQVEGPDVPRREGRVHVLIFGGSQGAGSLNDHMPGQLAGLPEELARGLVVRHQAGRGRDAPVREAYEGFVGEAEVTEFIDDMPGAYRWSDLVVCRAGATTVAELKAAGKAAILVPFPHAAHNHQEKNAQAMVEAGAAKMLLDAALCEGDAMREALEGCLRAPERIREMEEAALALAQPEAADDVARSCLELCRG